MVISTGLTINIDDKDIMIYKEKTESRPQVHRYYIFILSKNPDKTATFKCLKDGVFVDVFQRNLRQTLAHIMLSDPKYGVSELTRID